MVRKNEKLVKQLKNVWEEDHGEDVSEAYNGMVSILATLDMYSANILVNLLWLQTTQKTLDKTVGKSEVKING